jgi:hypothetical protein
MTEYIGIDGLNCCGINEIDGIGDYPNEPEKIIEDVCNTYIEEQRKCAYYIFSDIGKKTAGINLAEFITKNNLGLVTLLPTKINPNSRHSLNMWIWSVNAANLKKYWKKNH